MAMFTMISKCNVQHGAEPHGTGSRLWWGARVGINNQSQDCTEAGVTLGGQVWGHSGIKMPDADRRNNQFVRDKLEQEARRLI